MVSQDSLSSRRWDGTDSSSVFSSPPPVRLQSITSDPSAMGSSSKRSSSRRGERDSRREDRDRSSSYRDRDRDHDRHRDRRSQSSRRDRQKSRSKPKEPKDDYKDDRTDSGTDPELSEYDDDDKYSDDDVKYKSTSRRSRRSGGAPYPEDDAPFTDSGYAASSDKYGASRPPAGRVDPSSQTSYGSPANQPSRQDPYGAPILPRHRSRIGCMTDMRMRHSFFGLRSALVIRTVAVWIFRPLESAARSPPHPARHRVQSAAYRICSTAGRDSSRRSSWVQCVLDAAAASQPGGADSLPVDTLRRLPTSTAELRPAANRTTAVAVAAVPKPRLLVQSDAAKLPNLAGSTFDAAFGADLLGSVATGFDLAAESSSRLCENR